MIVYLSLLTEAFGFQTSSDQQLRTEGSRYGDISLKLSKDLLRVQIMWKLDLSMRMDKCQHPKLLTKKIPHKNSQQQKNTLTWKDTACLKWTVMWAVLFEAFYKPLFQEIFIHTYVKAKECLNK